MAAAGSFKQDMPPPGGYANINWKRNPARKVMTGWPRIFGFFGGLTALAWAIYIPLDRRYIRQVIESKSMQFAITPMLLAERDRMYLKQLRRNREVEEELMKDFPGWKVGTWQGEKVYKTIPDDTWRDINLEEFYAHSSSWDLLDKKMGLSWW